MALKEKRLEKGLTQMDVAKILDVSFQAVSFWEKGNKPWSKYMTKLCKLFNCTEEELFPSGGE